MAQSPQALTGKGPGAVVKPATSAPAQPALPEGATAVPSAEAIIRKWLDTSFEDHPPMHQVHPLTHLQSQVPALLEALKGKLR